MAPASTDDQFKFLISCIRYSNNGKVDFAEVAKECEIVTKGAAAKRYERMMKAHGIHQSQAGTPVRDTSSTSTPRRKPSPRRKTSPIVATPSKKRKLNQFTETSAANTDDDEGLTNIKPESSTSAIKAEPIKEEPDATVSTSGLASTSTNNVNQIDGAEDGLFNSFLHPHAFGEHTAYSGQLTDQQLQEVAIAALTAMGEEPNKSIVISD